MALHYFRKGLDLPMAGAPEQAVHAAAPVSHVALVGDDFHGLKPRVRVSEGQLVRRGELLCEDAAVPGVRHTAHGAGRVVAVHRGARRRLDSIVIALSEGEQRGTPSEDELEPLSVSDAGAPDAWDGTRVRGALVQSGMWTAFRTRPFSRVPPPDATPSAIFVTAMDTSPLAADPDVVLDGGDAWESLALGLRAVAKLSDGETFLCVQAGSTLTRGLDAPVRVEEFAGPHPAGTVGLHIHTLKPVSRARTVWTVGYQDVVSIGRTLRSGHLDVSRVVALAGPPVPRPRLLRTRLGAAVADLVRGEGVGDRVRWISGSVLAGKATDRGAFGYMGRYDFQLTALAEGGERELLAWLAPGLRKFSVLPVFASRLLRRGAPDMTTDTHGSRRAMIPIGLYERVMPMDILPTFLLRALAVNDIERAEELGCLELDEEDLALCSFVDPGKTAFGPLRRRTLDAIAGGA